MTEIRKLRADEIECRVSTINAKGCSLLLYKDARCDQRLLDEVYGSMNWKRSHQLIDGDLYCTIEVWDADKEQWIAKQDVGTESYTEKEKGRASDSFKRAAFNFGIGRELYTAPFIWINKSDVNLIEDGGKFKTYDHFTVKSIGYEGDKITSLEIVNDKMKRTVYTLGKLAANFPLASESSYTPVLNPSEEEAQMKATPEQVMQIEDICTRELIPTSYIYEMYKKKSLNDLSRVQAYSVVKSFDKFKERYQKELPFK